MPGRVRFSSPASPFLTFILKAEVAKSGLTRKPGKLVPRKGSLGSNPNLGANVLFSNRGV